MGGPLSQPAMALPSCQKMLVLATLILLAFCSEDKPSPGSHVRMVRIKLRRICRKTKKTDVRGLTSVAIEGRYGYRACSGVERSRSVRMYRFKNEG